MTTIDLELKDVKRIADHLEPKIKPMLQELVKEKDIEFHLDKQINKIVEKHMDAIRRDIQNIVKEELKIQSGGIQWERT